MKTSLIAIAFTSLAALPNMFPQSLIVRNRIEYITKNPVKSEDGCGYFADNIDSLKRGRSLFIIGFNSFTKKNTAYMQINDNEFIYFTRLKRIVTTKGYKDVYIGRGAAFELSINKITKTGSYTSQREGHISLTINKSKIEFPVWGRDEESDSYNKPTYK